jgi:hypothetical protein
VNRAPEVAKSAAVVCGGGAHNGLTDDAMEEGEVFWWSRIWVCDDFQIVSSAARAGMRFCGWRKGVNFKCIFNFSAKISAFSRTAETLVFSPASIKMMNGLCSHSCQPASQPANLAEWRTTVRSPDCPNGLTVQTPQNENVTVINTQPLAPPGREIKELSRKLVFSFLKSQGPCYNLRAHDVLKLDLTYRVRHKSKYTRKNGPNSLIRAFTRCDLLSIVLQPNSFSSASKSNSVLIYACHVHILFSFSCQLYKTRTE